MFLHGGAERGENLRAVTACGPPRRVEDGADLPFILVSPQCPSGSWWTREVPALMALLEGVVGERGVDPDRVYLTGHSMGGMGAWQFAGMCPEYFAAVSAVCGGGEPYAARSLAQGGIPIRLYHGDRDEVVPLAETERMMYWLNRFGGTAELTVLPGVGHDAWTSVYAGGEWYEWLLGHTRPST
jgi:predicted peptidase